MTCKNHTRELLSAFRSPPPRPVLNPGRFCFRKTTTFADFGPSERGSVSSARGSLQVVCYTGVGLHRKWHMQPDWDSPRRRRHKHRAQMGPGASGSSTLMNTQLSTTLHNMQNNILRPGREMGKKLNRYHLNIIMR